MAKRMTVKARRGLVRMAAYWLTCLDSWGAQFEDAPRTLEEAKEVNAGLDYLGLYPIDLAALFDVEGPDEEDEAYVCPSCGSASPDPSCGLCRD